VPCAAGPDRRSGHHRSRPEGMSAAGFGDLLGKYSALADWRIAQELGIEPIEPISWGLMEQGCPVGRATLKVCEVETGKRCAAGRRFGDRRIGDANRELHPCRVRK